MMRREVVPKTFEMEVALIVGAIILAPALLKITIADEMKEMVECGIAETLVEIVVEVHMIVEMKEGGIEIEEIDTGGMIVVEAGVEIEVVATVVDEVEKMRKGKLKLS